MNNYTSIRFIIFTVLTVAWGSVDAQNTFPSSGNVGIGTTSPAFTLDINGGTSWINTNPVYQMFTSSDKVVQVRSSSQSVVNLMSGANTDGALLGGIYFGRTAGATDAWYNLMGIAAVQRGTGVNADADIVIRGHTAGEIMRIAQTGNVGIGTTSPLGRLDIYDPTANSALVLSSGYNSGAGSNKNWAIMQSGYNYGDLSFNESNSTGGNPVSAGTSRFLIQKLTGNIGIGTTSPSEKLSVNGNIRSKKIIVTQNGWADYVFNDGYWLRPLSEVELFIKTNKHLPEVPTAKEVEDKGLDVGKTQALLLKKIEELTLYIIEIKKENGKMKELIEAQQKQIQRLEK